MILKHIPGFKGFAGQAMQDYQRWDKHAETVRRLIEDIKERTPIEHYDSGLAELCAYLSTWIYADEYTIGTALAEIGLKAENWRFFATNNIALFIDTQALVVRLPLAGNKSLGFVVFRGTEDLIDVLTDLNTKPVKFLNGTVHKGFLDALFPVLSLVEQELEENPVSYLYFAGHSLGAALAVLGAAHALEQKGIKDHQQLCGIYTYGQPMVGREDFPGQEFGRDMFVGKLYRHVYLNDVVPRLPPRSVDKQYVHIGTEYGVDRHRDCWVKQPAREQLSFIVPSLVVGATDFLARRFVFGREHNFVLDFITGQFGSIDDHLPDVYNRVTINSLHQVCPAMFSGEPMPAQDAPEAATVDSNPPDATANQANA